MFERSDADVRALEGLPSRVGVISGSVPEPVSMVEDGLKYRVDVAHGQKTGFYLDQRDNRRRVRELARDRDVLNAFCYTGGFSIAALAGGARSVLSIDSSAEALATAALHVADNGLDASRAEWRDADVFSELRKLRDAARGFDLIVLDPPKFAPTAHHAEKATRAYKDVNLLALKLLRPGRPARDLLLLRGRFRGPVPEGRRRRRARRACGRRDRRTIRGLCRSSGRARLPGRRLPQGSARPQTSVVDDEPLPGERAV